MGNALHQDRTTRMKYWRDASGILYGDLRARFREEALALGFEPYAAAGYGVPVGTVGTGRR